MQHEGILFCCNSSRSTNLLIPSYELQFVAQKSSGSYDSPGMWQYACQRHCESAKIFASSSCLGFFLPQATNYSIWG